MAHAAHHENDDFGFDLAPAMGVHDASKERSGGGGGVLPSAFDDLPEVQLYDPTWYANKLRGEFGHLGSSRQFSGPLLPKSYHLRSEDLDNAEHDDPESLVFGNIHLSAREAQVDAMNAKERERERKRDAVKARDVADAATPVSQSSAGSPAGSAAGTATAHGGLGGLGGRMAMMGRESSAGVARMSRLFRKSRGLPESTTRPRRRQIRHDRAAKSVLLFASVGHAAALAHVCDVLQTYHTAVVLPSRAGTLRVLVPPPRVPATGEGAVSVSVSGSGMQIVVVAEEQDGGGCRVTLRRSFTSVLKAFAGDEFDHLLSVLFDQLSERVHVVRPFLDI